MKSIRTLGLFALALVAAAGCGVTAKTFTVRTEPKLELSPSRTVIKADLAVVVDAKVAPTMHLERAGGKVILDVTNFREALEGNVIKGLQPQFKSVTARAKETGQGLELVVMNANYPEVTDVMAYHYVLMSDGKMIYEAKSRTVPPTKMVSANAFTYQTVLKDLTLEMMASNLNQVAESIRDGLLINEKLNDFWSKFE